MLINALLGLMEKKEFSKISIKELCSTALVSRQTFYTLFNGKEEVIGLHLDTLFSAYIKEIQNSKKELSVNELCSITISCLVKEKKLIQLMVESNLDYIVKNNELENAAMLSQLIENLITGKYFQN